MNPQEILNRLLNAEFKELKKEYGNIEVRWKNHLRVRILRLFGIKMKEKGLAWVSYSPYWGYDGIIYLDKLRKEELLRDEKRLKKILRHECLHLFLGPVSAQKFDQEARKKGIKSHGRKD